MYRGRHQMISWSDPSPARQNIYQCLDRQSVERTRRLLSVWSKSANVDGDKLGKDDATYPGSHESDMIAVVMRQFERLGSS